ncbi:hypothetical protein [Clostridium sp.]|uniref:hypothetical protein n=1 Tax=Clostridium sp. TaxID=1506 RepID=UPI001B50A895|nr:hypothetical protein [Clostridium sp.]MBP3915916.1 hypothetical protein [Clostridium sp.]
MRGRPSRKEENAVKMVSVRMTLDEVSFVEEVINNYGDISRSDFIREAIMYYSSVIKEEKKAINV